MTMLGLPIIIGIPVTFFIRTMASAYCLAKNNGYDLPPYNVYSFRVRKEDKITLKGSAQKWGK